MRRRDQPRSRRRPFVAGACALLAAAALAGASLVVAADLAARVARPPAELPLGAVTALVGVPFFLVQLRRLA
jgi:iron complex transport system permease protein